jgi:jagged-1
MSQETCLSPPCLPKGDCRALEPSRRVAPPAYPAPVECWPNQAILDDQCSRVSILLELSQLPKGSSVDSMCHSLRTLLGEKLLQSPKSIANTLLVLLCDMKNGTNDTIEMTISSPPRGKASSEAIKTAVRHLEELLARPIKSLESSFFLEHPEAKPLSAILEIKVETESIRNEHNSFFLATILGIGIVALLCGACIAVMWRQRFSSFSGSGVNLTPPLDTSRFEDEKHNNLQNEENIRRYANPLKGSVTSIHGAMELNFSPTPDVAQLSNVAGHSAQQRSQTLFPNSEVDYEKEHELAKPHHRRSQHLLYKTQNTDMTKNTMGSSENWVEIKNIIPKNIVL